MDEPPPVRGQRSGDAEQRDDPFGRPMPDGGLAEAMPDWLRRPPAWRETTARSSKAAPIPDTSPIDPRTLIDVEDLPIWLQRIAQRPAERSERIDVVEPPGQPVPRAMPVVDPHRERRARALERGLPGSAAGMSAAEGNGRLRGERVRPSEQGAVSPRGQTGEASERRRRNRRWFTLLLVCILMVVGVALFTLFT